MACGKSADAGEHVADSPYTARVLSGRPSVKHCTVTGDGRRSAVAGQPAHFTVEARDEFGNRYDQLTDAVSLRPGVFSIIAQVYPTYIIGLQPSSNLHIQRRCPTVGRIWSTLGTASLIANRTQPMVYVTRCALGIPVPGRVQVNYMLMQRHKL